ncbi:MAG: hypothetical protein FWH37_03795 [Candidatus Bathyarchaeota archaeon]|nr:hypothetical protein [Candidatus Termiticorpusculum sp.]
MTVQIRETQKTAYEYKPNNSYDENLLADILSKDVIIQPTQPVNIDIFYPIMGTLKALTDSDVQNNVYEIIQTLYRVITELRVRVSFTNYLSKLHLTEQEDKTALLEWNFEKFRFGFTIESILAKSSYYYVAVDHDNGIYKMDSEKFGDHVDIIVKRIVNYVLANT